MSKQKPVLVVGLAGGIAGGKSLVASMMEKLGARVLNADAINHDVLTDARIVEKVVGHWGAEVLNDRGEVDRAKLARKVFASSEQVRLLESIVHPEVCRRISAAIEAERVDSTSFPRDPESSGREAPPRACRGAGGTAARHGTSSSRHGAPRRIGAVVVIDAPLLFEAGLDEACDRIVYVDAPDEVRVHRAMKSRNWDRKELKRRESHQKSLSCKRNRADIVIANDSSTDALRKQVERLWDQLTRLISQ